jgi:hypothetical protein
MNRRNAIGLIGSGLILAGCSGNGTTGIFNQPGPRVRAVDAYDGTSQLDWNVTGSTGVTFPAVNFGSASNGYSSPYEILNERGSQTISFYNPNSATVAIATATHDFVYGDKITAIAYNGAGAASDVIVLHDQTTDSTNGPNLRIVDAAAQTGSVDIFVTPSGQNPSGSPATLTPGTVSPAQSTSSYAYTPLSAQSYNVYVYPQGKDTGTALVTYPITVGGEDVWTLVLLDPTTNGNPPTILAIQDNNPNAG